MWPASVIPLPQVTKGQSGPAVAHTQHTLLSTRGHRRSSMLLLLLLLRLYLITSACSSASLHQQQHQAQQLHHHAIVHETLFILAQPAQRLCSLCRKADMCRNAGYSLCVGQHQGSTRSVCASLRQQQRQAHQFLYTYVTP
jgi:hypothetical protein